MQCAELEKQKYNSIDLVKFFMAFAVIAAHTGPLVNCKNGYVLAIYDSIVGMAVPFFFLATGYLLSKKMSFPYGESDIPIMRRTLIKILKMYIIWMIIYTPMLVYYEVVSGTPPLRAIEFYIRRLFFVGEHYNSWQLWYLLSEIYALIVIMLLVRLKTTPKGLLLASLLVSFISIGINWFMDLEGDLPAVVFTIQRTIVDTIRNGRIFSGMIYIPIGMYLAHRPLPRLWNVVLFAAGSILRLYVTNFLSVYILVATAVGFFGIVEGITLKSNPVYPWLRNVSTIIYLIHMYVWSFYYKIVYGEKTFGLDSFIVTSLASCIIAVTYLMVKRTRNDKKKPVLSVPGE